MSTAQGGIFALGTAAHAYLEFDALAGADRPGLAGAISALREPRTTMGGVNLVAGPGVALIPDGRPGAGGTILLLQRWAHDAAEWESLPVAQQEQVIGRTKPDSLELADRAPDSHVGSTDQERFGEIFRRNMPYGTVTDHGTMFVGFSADQRRLSAMLASMAGLAGGGRDALTRYTRPLTGVFNDTASTESLRLRIDGLPSS